MYEVFEKLPGKLVVLSRCCLMNLGGSGEQSGIFVSWRADMARDILILSGNRLLKHDLQLGIVLCQDHLVEAMLWGGPRMCKQNGTIIFRNSFQKNQFRALYIARTA